MRDNIMFAIEAVNAWAGRTPRLRLMVEASGERAACAALRIPRATLARALAGLPVRRGTAVLVSIALAQAEPSLDTDPPPVAA